MRIGIISDTHGSLLSFERALEVLGKPDLFLHLGDVLAHGPRNDLPKGYRPREMAEKLAVRSDFIYIKGNCDAEVDEMVIHQDISQHSRILELGGYRIMAEHGHKRSREEMLEAAKRENIDLLLYGHTHIKELTFEEGIVVCNPGSTTIPKDGVASVALLDEDRLSLLSMGKGDVIKTIRLEKCDYA